jgi:CRISPR system Cascade subunit CasC
MIVELHIIQNFAPSCLNRDDVNQPKTCEFGGHRRARISSQCIKRSVRWHPVFQEATAGNGGIRTRRLLLKLVECLGARGIETSEDDPVLVEFVKALGLKFSDKPGARTQYALYLGNDEIERIVDALAEGWGDMAGSKKRDGVAKKLGKQFERLETRAADIALFGRMIANRPRDNVEAACQVAHALSTNKVSMEMDFFTAVDDLPHEDEAGAGMMGNAEFNSSCFYRYSLVNWGILLSPHNLANEVDLARKAVEGYLRASILAIPTGKQNSHAAHNPPGLVMAVVRESGAPWSLAGAFEKPVLPRHDMSLTAGSITALNDYWQGLTTMYGDSGIAARPACWIDGVDAPALADQREACIDDLIATVMGYLPKGGS